ncbi:hypothetical protein [Cohnella boryungensis]|uniref:Lipoprotein n=1 Tax=Cohnella boryungensis TaxID=768479 RepID=A0ABV8SHN5_9BACL
MMNLGSTLKKLPVLAMAFALVACSSVNEPAGSPRSTASPSQNASASSPAPSANTPAPSEKPPGTARPQTESFDLITGPQAATLHQGDGFSLYLFDGFVFDADQGRLSLEKNSDYDVEIKLLPTDEDLSKLRAAGEEELAKAGKVSDYSGELVEHPLGSAELYLQAESGDGISDYIVWKAESGDRFLFRLHNPKGKEASDFANPVLVTLSTVQAN